MLKLKNSFSWLRNTDMLVALGFITIIVMLIVPIPTAFLDIGIALNISATLIIMLTVVYITQATEFSVFPTLILFTTLFRIALNVSSTRLILLQGQSFNGEIIKSFGDFVVGGNYVVGLVIFLILVAVQVVVITKGASRVSEVAARFTLDALPGKQMEITNELSSNLITEEEAKIKKKAIQKEADFYGAMDGASKFVQGDVRLGVIIIVINIIGGMVVGTVQQGMSFSEAGRLFLQLTVGDGLVSQIPSLLMSVATGVIVTRSASDGSFGNELAKELTFSPQPLYITSGFLVGLGLLPGFPTFSMLVLASLLGVAGYFVQINGPFTVNKKEEEPEVVSQDGEEDIFSVINIDPIELEIGFSLIPLVDPNQGGDLLDRIKLIRKTMALELGLAIPPIRIRDNMRLAPNDYVVKIKGMDFGNGILKLDHYLAISPAGTKVEEMEELEGVPVYDPVFQANATWVKEEKRQEAEQKGYTIVDCPTVIATHLTEIFRYHGFELLGRQEVKKILDAVREEYSVIIAEAEKVGMGEIQKIFQNLLKDGVSIRNLISILEVIVDSSHMGLKNIDIITERVRTKLGKQIVQQYLLSNSLESLQVITLDKQWETLFENSIQETETQIFANVNPVDRSNFISQLGDFLTLHSQIASPTIVVSDKIRALVKNLIRSSFVKIQVFSYAEVAAADSKLDHLGLLEYSTPEKESQEMA